jgi:hypothetical protein
VSDRLRTAAVLGIVGLAIGLGGCGGSSSHGAGTTPASSSSSVSKTVSTTASATSQPGRSSTQTATPTSTAAPNSVATAPPPTPAGTPAPPDGLRPTAGYATYELCSNPCSGAVPSSLRRALHLPGPSAGAGCPISSGSGPVTPEGSAQIKLTPFIGSSWKAARVTWEASDGYKGPVLIRGRQISGSGALGFGEGHTPYDELQLLASGMGAPTPSGGGRAWLSFTRASGPGCYAYQVDGTSFSSVIVFRAS